MTGNNDNKFVSHDGPDANGVRAEVYVQKGTGTIVNIKPGATNVTAQVAVKNENPKVKFPLMGWVQLSDPIYPLIQEAFDAQTPIEYRFESQRKSSEPRDAPIGPLRQTLELAREHTTPIFAAINGQLSSEAVTSPAEDPAPGGRIRAADPVPAAPQQHSQQQSQQQSQRSRSPQDNQNVSEEAPFREFNSDGSVNYGSYAVTAAVGAESLVRRLLLDRETSADTIAHYAIVILAIADTVQKYATGKKPSRMAGSHTRVRGIVYDTVENYFPIPASPEQDLEWVSKVGTLSRERFAIIERIASTNFDFGSLKQKPKNESRAEPVDEAPAMAPMSDAEPTPPPVEAPEPAPAQESAPEPALGGNTPAEGDLSALGILGGNAEKAFEIYPQQDISELSDAAKVSKETLETFKDWVEENNFNLTAIFKLLKFTFGSTGHVATLPEESFTPFLDFYVSQGEENFIKVLDYANTVSGS